MRVEDVARGFGQSVADIRPNCRVQISMPGAVYASFTRRGGEGGGVSAVPAGVVAM
jgi:hypothetical protein